MARLSRLLIAGSLLVLLSGNALAVDLGDYAYDPATGITAYDGKYYDAMGNEIPEEDALFYLWLNGADVGDDLSTSQQTDNPRSREGGTEAELPLPVLNHISGVYEARNDSTRADQDLKRLSDLYTTQAVTMQLTEPAVSVGATNSAMLAYLDDMGRKQSHEALLSTLSRLGPWGDDLTLAYLNCIARKSQGAGSQSSWRKAQSECIGDIYPDERVSGGTRSKYAIAITNTGFSLGDHPDSVASSATGPSDAAPDPQQQHPPKQFLADLIFNGFINSTTGEQQTHLKTLRDEFNALVGAVQVEFQLTGTNKYRPVFTSPAPTTTVAARTEQLQQDIWARLVDIFNRRCQSATNNTVTEATQNFTLAPDSFWTSVAPQEIELISVPKIPAKVLYLNILYDSFMERNADLQMNCATRFNSTAPAAGGTGGGSLAYATVFGPGAERTLRSETQNLRFFTEKTAQGKMLDTLGQIEQLLISMELKGSPAAAKGLSLLRVRANATQKSIDEQYAAVVDDMNKFFERIRNVAGSQSGRKSRGIVGMFSRREQSSAGPGGIGSR